MKHNAIHLSYLGGSVSESFPYSEYIKQPYPDLVAEILTKTIPTKTSLYPLCPSMHSVTFQMAPGEEKKKFILEYVGYVE